MSINKTLQILPRVRAKVLPTPILSVENKIPNKGQATPEPVPSPSKNGLLRNISVQLCLLLTGFNKLFFQVFLLMLVKNELQRSLFL